MICRNDKSYKGKHSADWSGYADDLELFCKDQHSLEKALRIMDRIFKRFMLKINVSKTKTMIFNFGGPEEDYPKTLMPGHVVPSGVNAPPIGRVWI